MSNVMQDLMDRSGGRWAKLKEVGDTFAGQLVAVEFRDRRDLDGAPVIKKGTNNVRQELLVTIKVESEGQDDDGLRRFAANESAQQAIGQAFKEAGVAETGGRLVIRLTADNGTMKQASYQAKYTAPANKTMAALVDDLV